MTMYSGMQFFQKSTSHLKILGTRKVTRSLILIEVLQMLGATLKTS
jgi:hypothetical protein